MIAINALRVLILLIWLVFSEARAAVTSLNLFADMEHTPFELGVASGDPEPSSVLLWTRAQRNGPTSDMFIEDQNITWRIWRVDDSSVEQNGTVVALLVNDLAITVDVDGLDPDTVYNYQFVHEASGNRSVIGRTRTAPSLASEQDIKIAAVSCSSIWSGYMNSYNRIAELEDINVVVHVGDFIYPELDRSSCQRIPPGLDTTCRDECIGKELPPDQAVNITALIQRHSCSASPEDYFRWVYQYYLHDPFVREFRRAHPIISIFDNHDVGASRSVNLTLDGGLQAFMEYVPVRAKILDDNATVQFFRELRFGKLVDLIALDTRALGVNVTGDGTYLGQSQLQWLEPVLQNSTDATWRIILTTVAFAPWAINGWDVYVNSIFAGTFVGLLLLSMGCIGGFCYLRKRTKRKMSAETVKVDSDMETADQKQPVAFPKQGKQMIALKCCVIYGIINVLIVIIVWIVATAVVNRLIVARKLSVNSSGNSLALVAGQDRNWDGHPQDRRDFLASMKQANVAKNNVWVSGDLHMSLAADVRDIDHTDSNSVNTAERFGVEMLSSSVSRANVDEIVSNYMPGTFAAAAANLAHTIMNRANPHFKYFETTEHGYGILLFTKDNVTGQYWHTPVLEQTSQQWLAKQVVCLLDENKWID